MLYKIYNALNHVWALSRDFGHKFFLLVVEYRKTFVGVFVSSYTLSESKYDLHCVWPAMANLIPFALLLCIKTVSSNFAENKIKFWSRLLTYVLTVFSKTYQIPYFKTFKFSMILVHRSANFTIPIFFYYFTGFTPLVGFLDVICSSVGFAYHVNGSWF